MDDYLEIPTPENISFGYPLAGIGSRFIAALIDTTLILLLQGAVLLFTGLVAGLLDDLPADYTGILLAVTGLVSFAFLWGYYIFFEVLWNGQSPGKRVTGLRVIRADGAPVSLAESAVRNLVRFIDFLPLFYGLGVAAMFIDRRSRRLGDMAADTLVVRETGIPVRLEDLQPTGADRRGPVPQLKAYGELPVEKLTEPDLELIRDFLKRRGEITNADAIETQVLERVFERMGLPSSDLWAHQRTDLLQQILAARNQE